MIRKEWLKDTPLAPEKGAICIKSRVDFSSVKLSPSPTLLNRQITKSVEILWCSSAKIRPIRIAANRNLVTIEKDGTEEVAHVFKAQVISFLNNHRPEKECQIVVKTRLPLADPEAAFHEIRHMEPM